MTLASGARLGPYEVLSPLGAGGMGEVYRSRDTRLSREVAIKVLPSELASDASRLKRFEKEARSASALNHPNIVTVHDIGSENGVSYIAMELVTGETLRKLLVGGALPLKRLLPIATQIAEGLAKAHEAGIVHRDLKPENLMLTKDGLVKILDFGLAKPTHVGSGSDEGPHLPTETGTSPGTVVGTVGYMSPEQASGEVVDFRSDQFAFGSIVYEMVTGKRAFQKKTAVDTLSAILNEEPPRMTEVAPQAPAPLRWIVERCLAKEPEGRYASTRDLSNDLVGLSGHLSDELAWRGEPRSRLGLRRQKVLTASLALAVVILGSLLVWKWPRPAPGGDSPRFRQVTFEEQGIMTARFAPDGETFVYAAWRKDGDELFMGRVGSPESRPLGIPARDICSISKGGQMAFLQDGGDTSPGTLAQAALAGGSPRKLLENVWDADWSPDGKTLAVVRSVDGNHRLEFPVGKVLYERGASAQIRSSIRGCRVSPKGDLIAFIEPGGLALVDHHGKVKRLRQAADCDFFAWSPRGDEIWYAKIEGGATELRAVTPNGRDRLLASLAGDFQIRDISRTGRVLLEKGTNRSRASGRLRGDSGERNLSHLAGTQPVDLSADGSRLLFNEIESYGTSSTIYLREAGSPPVLIGRGYARALSPDGNWVIATSTGIADEIDLLPAGAGEPRRLPNGGLNTVGWANWLPDGKRIVFAANAAGAKPRIYLQNISDGLPRPITPQGVYLPNFGGSVVSPDGKLVVGMDEKKQASLYPIEGGDPQPVRGLESRHLPEFPIQWSQDGRRLFVRRPVFPGVFLLDPATGERKPWMQFSPDPGGWISAVVISRDGKSYVRQMSEYSSNLFALDGIR
ncbi:MAG: protein kinase [Thermoanaerobaculia bacterium]